MRTGAEFFTEPSGSAERGCEGMRAYFVDEWPAAQVADQFGYSTASVHQMATLVRSGRMRLFTDARPGPKGPTKATGPVREKVLALRQRRLPVTEIARLLAPEGTPLSAQTPWKICDTQGQAPAPAPLLPPPPPRVQPAAAHRPHPAPAHPRPGHRRGRLQLRLPRHPPPRRRPGTGRALRARPVPAHPLGAHLLRQRPRLRRDGLRQRRHHQDRAGSRGHRLRRLGAPRVWWRLDSPPDVLVWVTVVFHGTAAWRNHGLIIFRFCFIEHLSSCAVQLPRLVAGCARQAAPGVGHLLVGHPALRRGFPGLVKGDASASSPATPEAPLTWAGVPWHPSRGRRGDARPPPHPS